MLKVQNNTVQHCFVRLLVRPLKKNSKTDIVASEKFITWWHLVQHLGKCNKCHWKTVLVRFLVYCFGCSKSEEPPPGKKFDVLHIPCAKALAYMLDHEPAEQPTSERQK